MSPWPKLTAQDYIKLLSHAIPLKVDANLSFDDLKLIASAAARYRTQLTLRVDEFNTLEDLVPIGMAGQGFATLDVRRDDD